MVGRYVYTHKRRKIGKEILEKEEHEKPVDINSIDDYELGKLIKAKVIKWQDIKKWDEKKQTKN